ncbi:hypothetical protein Mpsy_0008 [Methanolobus psychrophilus R15]|nr:hypothetical protein Mpsy_0008 [Methanolobus psychrophilus R15]
MKKPLLHVMFASEKRKEVLLLLQNGPKDMEYLLKSLDTSRQALLPQIRILEDHYLITNERDTCILTHLGKLIVDDIALALKNIDVFSNNIEYWGSHDLHFIPPHLLKRINELESCTSVTVQISEIFDEDETFVEEAKRTKFICTVTSFMFPHFEKLFTEMTELNVNASFIVSDDLYQKLLHEKSEDLQYISQNPNIELYRYPSNFPFTSFTLTDHAVMLRTFTLEGGYDTKRIICSSEDALKWGKELYEYYLKDSILITEIEHQ